MLKRRVGMLERKDKGIGKQDEMPEK